MGAAVAEFKRRGMAAADVREIVSAAGVAHGTFFFHFPTKEHVLLELELREEQRIAKQLTRFASADPTISATLKESLRFLLDLERRLGPLLFRDFLALHFSPTRPPAEDGASHPVIVCVADEMTKAQMRGEVDPKINPLNSAAFFLLGLYALLTTTSGYPHQSAMIEDYLATTIRGLGVSSAHS